MVTFYWEKLVGHRITHQKLGLGTIVSISPDFYIKVKFDEEYNGIDLREFNTEAFEEGYFGDINSDSLLYELVASGRHFEQARIDFDSKHRNILKLLNSVFSYFSVKDSKAYISHPKLFISDIKLALLWIASLSDLSNKNNYYQIKNKLLEKYKSARFGKSRFCPF